MKNEERKNFWGARVVDGKTLFRLWSPDLDRVSLCLYQADDRCLEEIPMERDGNWWLLQVDANLHGQRYLYRLWRKGEDEAVFSTDPFALSCDTDGRHSVVIDGRQTDPDGWDGDEAPEMPSAPSVYELHVKEFSWDPAGGFPEEVRGRYSAFACKDTWLNGDPSTGIRTGLSYIASLGVTHIQFMPIYDFGSVRDLDREAFNWGYDPVNYNVPEGSYCSDPEDGAVRVRELKAAVQAIHRKGLRVIMDVVYNHTYSLDTALQRTAPWRFYRKFADGRVSNGSACSNDIASERPWVRDYIVQSVLYWAEEYHIDGFRFDLMGLLDTETMNAIRTALDERFGVGEKLIYGEPWRARETAMEEGFYPADKEYIDRLLPGIGYFSDDIRDAVKGPIFFPEKGGFVNGGEGYTARLKELLDQEKTCEKPASRIVTYVSAHDNHSLWDRLEQTTDDEELLRRQYRLAQVIAMSFRGLPFILSGEEFCRTKDGIEDAFQSPISVNRLDWSQIRENAEEVTFFRGLLALRKKLPALSDRSDRAGRRLERTWGELGIAGYLADNCPLGDASEPESKKKGEDLDYDKVLVLFNRRSTDMELALPEGKWQVLLEDHDSFLWQKNVSLEGQVTLRPVSALILGQKC